jgi:hypothetical protein
MVIFNIVLCTKISVRFHTSLNIKKHVYIITIKTLWDLKKYAKQIRLQKMHIIQFIIELIGAASLGQLRILSTI